MPYPRKVDRRIIIDAAVALVEREGEQALALRRVAEDVGVTANALYRYFATRGMLVAATADAVAHRLSDAIDEGMADLPEGETVERRIRNLLTIYSNFAQTNPALYSTFQNADREAAAKLPRPRYHEILWDQSLSIIEPLVGSEDGPAATVSLWALLHGMWALRQAGVLGGKKPADISDYAFEVIIRGLSR